MATPLARDATVGGHRRRRDGRRHRAGRRAGGASRAAVRRAHRRRRRRRSSVDRRHARDARGEGQAATRTREGGGRADRRRSMRSATCVSAKLVVEAIVEDLDAKRKLFRELEVVVARRRDPRDEHVVAVDHRARRGHEASRARRRHALLQPGAGAAAGRGGERARHRCGRSRRPSTTPPRRGARRRCTRRRRRASSSTAARGRSTARRCACCRARGRSPATIDAVMREAGGFRMGPFELMDLIGHDVNFAVTKSVWEAYFHDPRFTPSVAPAASSSPPAFSAARPAAASTTTGRTRRSPPPRPKPRSARPRAIVVRGDAGAATALVERIAAAGVRSSARPAHPRVPGGAARRRRRARSR